jgi:hypothetical protein
MHILSIPLSSAIDSFLSRNLSKCNVCLYPQYNSVFKLQTNPWDARDLGPNIHPTWPTWPTWPIENAWMCKYAVHLFVIYPRVVRNQTTRCWAYHYCPPSCIICSQPKYKQNPVRVHFIPIGVTAPERKQQ